MLSSMPSSMLSLYRLSLKTRPIATKVLTGATVAGSGDVAAQAIAWKASSSPLDFKEAWDFRRTLGVATFGASYSGFFSHYLFCFYARRFPTVNVPNTVRYLNAAKLTAFHQLCTLPLIYFPSFFLTVEAVRGLPLHSNLTNFRSKFWDSYKVGALVFTPVMAGQFLFVPLPMQVLYITSAAFGWVTYLSYAAL